jgi:hypothetical protein
MSIAPVSFSTAPDEWLTVPFAKSSKSFFWHIGGALAETMVPCRFRYSHASSTVEMVDPVAGLRLYMTRQK